MRKYFDRFSEWLVGFGIEPYLHILCTIVIAMMIARACLWTGADRTLAGCFAGFVALVIGFIKEAWDGRVTKVFDGMDVLAGFIGAVIFFLTWI